MSGRRLARLRVGARALSVCALAVSLPVQASPKGDLKDQARELSQQMRAAGAPESRCYLNANFSTEYILTGEGDLRPGDRLLYINNQNVAGLGDDDVRGILKAIAPDAIIPVRIERDGVQTDLQVQCSNAGMHQTALLKALKLAEEKKVDDCVTALEPIAGRDAQAALLRYQCAAASDRAASYNLGGYAAEVLENSIVYARYKADLRRETIQNLYANQGVLSKPEFERLAAMTKSWPGDETLFDKSKPDWRAFRENAQAAVLSGFFDPGAAIVEWPYGFIYGSWKPVLQGRIEGYWTCGRVNGKNRMGGYVGSRSFVVVLSSAGQPIFNEVGDGGTYDFVSGQCQNSVRMLPIASSQIADAPTAAAPTPAGRSVAEELAKLAELKASGALSEDEYKAAKAKVLGQD